MQKKFQKYLLISVFSFGLLFSVVLPALADSAAIDATKEDYRPEIVVDIGGFNSKENFSMPSKTACPQGAGTSCISISWLAQYIAVIYQFGIGLAGILAAAMILLGGFFWLTSFGSPEKVNKAKEYIIGALTGLMLALFSYMILFTINPALVSNRALVVSAVDPLQLTCCMNPDRNHTLVSLNRSQDCTAMGEGWSSAAQNMCDNTNDSCKAEGGSVIWAPAGLDQATEQCLADCKNSNAEFKEIQKAGGENTAEFCCKCSEAVVVGCCRESISNAGLRYGMGGTIQKQYYCESQNNCTRHFNPTSWASLPAGTPCTIDVCKTVNY